MLRGDAVGHRDALPEIPADDELAVGLQGGPGDLCPGQGGQLPLQLMSHRLGQGAGVSDQHGGGHPVVLRLAQQIRRHPGGIGAAVGQYQHLGGPGDHVDVYPAEDLALGLRHVGVSGAHDLIHLRDGPGAVGQGGHRLGAAHLVDPGHAGDFGCGQDVGVHRPIPPGRRHHNDLPHSGDPGGNGIHQHGGRVGGGAAGHIDAHPRQGDDPLAQHHALPLGHHEALPLLPGVVGPDVLRGLLQHGQEGRLHLRRRLVHLLRRHRQGVRRCAVKAEGILPQGRVPPLLHGPEDLRHRGGYVRPASAAEQDLPLLQRFHIIYFDHDRLTASAPGPPASRRSPDA